MTKKQIYNRLLAIAELPAANHHYSPNPFVYADTVDQEALFTIQFEILTLLSDLANETKQADALVERHPALFKAS